MSSIYILYTKSYIQVYIYLLYISIYPVMYVIYIFFYEKKGVQREDFLRNLHILLLTFYAYKIVPRGLDVHLSLAWLDVFLPYEQAKNLHIDDIFVKHKTNESP